jgi:hypothetical protein
MATGIFVDTAGWGNIIDPDQGHALATRLYRDARAQTSPIITKSYVSPDDPGRDFEVKRVGYAEAAIPEYWIIVFQSAKTPTFRYGDKALL